MKEKPIFIIILVVALVIVGALVYSQNKTAPSGNPTSTTNNTTKTTTTTKPADSKTVVSSTKSAKYGDYLTDSKGITLYVSGDDKKLQSSCNDECAKTWLPFMYDSKDLASSTDKLGKRLNVIKRSDGSSQYAYGEKPLYYYSGDKNPGDMNGNGLNDGKWSIVTIQ